MISDNDETAFNTDETAVNDDETAVDNDQTTGNKENIPNLKLRGEEQNGINLELIQKAIRYRTELSGRKKEFLFFHFIRISC